MSDAIKLHAQVQELERELSATTNQLARICKEGFDNQDTIGGEPADDYVLRKLAELHQALLGRTVSCSQCNAFAKENAEMREVIKDAHDALEGCQEDTCELIAERDWWKNEPRCGYSARWAEMNVRCAKAIAALAKLQPFIP